MWADSLFFFPHDSPSSQSGQARVCVESPFSSLYQRQLLQPGQSANAIMSRLEESQTASDSCCWRVYARGVSLHDRHQCKPVCQCVFPCNTEPKKELCVGELEARRELHRCLTYIQTRIKEPLVNNSSYYEINTDSKNNERM